MTDSAGRGAAVLVVVLSVGLAAGFVLGRWTAPPSRSSDAIFDFAAKGDDESPNHADGGSDGAGTGQATTGAPGLAPKVTPEGNGERSSGRRAPYRARFFDRDGVLSGEGAAIALYGPWADESGPVALVGAEVARGAWSGVLVDGEVSVARLETIAYRRGRRGLMAVTLDRDLAAHDVAERIPVEAVDATLVPGPGHELPVFLTGVVFDPRRGVDALGIRETLSVTSGGVVLAENLVVGLVPDTPHGEPVRALPVSRQALRSYEVVGLTLEEAARAWFEGSAEAFLRDARKHLEARRYSLAITAYRAAFDRDPALREVADAELLEAWRGRFSRTVGASDEELHALLIDAVGDFPNHHEFLSPLIETSTRRREYAEALRWLDAAWNADPTRTGHLTARRAEVYKVWVDWLIRQRLFDDAIAVLNTAFADGSGTAELWRTYADLMLRLRAYADAAVAWRNAISLDRSLAATLMSEIERAERFAEGPGKVVIDYPPGARAIIATVTINGRANGEFLVDTGATSTMVPVDVARRAGLDLGPGTPKVLVRTAGGDRTLPRPRADSLAVGGLSVVDVDVIVGDMQGMGNRGLLGMDFLASFRIENDPTHGRMVLMSR